MNWIINILCPIIHIVARIKQTMFDIDLLFYSIRHQLLFGAFRAYDVLCIGNKSFSHHRCFTRRANKAVAVPMSTLQGYKSCSPNTQMMVGVLGSQIYWISKEKVIIFFIISKDLTKAIKRTCIDHHHHHYKSKKVILFY